MVILNEERPQNVNYHYAIRDAWEIPCCIRCKFSQQNRSYPKDEFDCSETGGICNAFWACERFVDDV